MKIHSWHGICCLLAALLPSSGLYVVIVATGNFALLKTALFIPLHILLWLFPAVMLSEMGGLLKTRTSLLLLALTIISSGFLIAGNLTGWFGFAKTPPRMWHETYHVRMAGEEASIVFLHIQNTDDRPISLRLSPATSPGETAWVLSAKQFDRADNVWLDYPAARLLSSRSLSMFPATILPNHSLLVEMIFFPTFQANTDDPMKQVNPSGRYSLLILDPAHMRIYHHEIDV